MRDVHERPPFGGVPALTGEAATPYSLFAAFATALRRFRATLWSVKSRYRVEWNEVGQNGVVRSNPQTLT